MAIYLCPVCGCYFSLPSGCPRECPRCKWRGGCDGFEEVEEIPEPNKIV